MPGFNIMVLVDRQATVYHVGVMLIPHRWPVNVPLLYASYEAWHGFTASVSVDKRTQRLQSLEPRPEVECISSVKLPGFLTNRHQTEESHSFSEARPSRAVSGTGKRAGPSSTARTRTMNRHMVFEGFMICGALCEAFLSRFCRVSKVGSLSDAWSFYGFQEEGQNQKDTIKWFHKLKQPPY